jgi:hypothetical protein
LKLRTLASRGVIRETVFSAMSSKRHPVKLT